VRAEGARQGEAVPIEYRDPAPTERDRFFEEIVEELGDDSAGALAFLGMTVETLRAIYQTVGDVRIVRSGGSDVGHLWIEERDRSLHVHAIILRPGARGRGIGTRVLEGLRREFAGRVDEIELGVRDENTGAVRFYERLGFRRAPMETAPGFSILRLSVRGDAPGDRATG